MVALLFGMFNEDYLRFFENIEDCNNFIKTEILQFTDSDDYVLCKIQGQEVFDESSIWESYTSLYKGTLLTFYNEFIKKQSITFNESILIKLN